MHKQLTEAEIAKNLSIFEKLVSIFPDGRREQIEELFKTSLGEHYLTAPASSRTEFHSCFPGGLLSHSLNVVKNLRKLVGATCPGEFSDATIAFVGLFHDLGKAGDGKEPYYIPNPSDWHRERGMLYEINKDCRSMPNSERGLFILQEHGIKLSFDEYLSIRLNDGQYAKENFPYKMQEPKLALLVHWADMLSCQDEKN
jgi:hypothetical protein